jgi:hypothetical protein
MRIITDAKAVRLDVHPAKIVAPELPLGAVCFKFENGDNFTLSVAVMHNLLRSVERWGGVLAEVSARDERLIDKGVVRAEDYPR